MVTATGRYNTAKIFTDNIEESALEQIENLLNQEFVKGSKIRIMPDVHAGAGCTIGTTMTITDKIVPNLVGVDIGCGMETVKIKNSHIELQKLDTIIHGNIPAGFEIRRTPHPYNEKIDLQQLRCLKHVNLKRATLSIGTLGGGNHFIEIGEDEDKNLYLVVHSGSRNLGKQVAEYYQRTAARDLKRKHKEALKNARKYKINGDAEKEKEEIKKATLYDVSRSLAFVEGTLFDDYIHDMELVQKYADLNRQAMSKEIIKRMKFKVEESFTTTHNYIDMETMILRKGAISAKKGEKMLIPINMRDGSLICVGKGNDDWNQSAPHGAGRIMSRRAAKQAINMKDFKESMKGVYSTTINRSTIDEAPFAYKPMEEIIDNIGETAEVLKHLKPIYNFKAAD